MAFDTAAMSSVADMISRRRSSRSAPCASRARARPRSEFRRRSWNSSNSTAPTSFISGSFRMRRVKRPSVITSIRVAAETFRSTRVVRPTVWPSRSPRVDAMRSAAIRAAIRRGSSIRMRPRITASPPSRPASASGTRVVLPAPGGAARTSRLPAASARRISGNTSSIGKGSCALIIVHGIGRRERIWQASRRKGCFPGSLPLPSLPWRNKEAADEGLV